MGWPCLQLRSSIMGENLLTGITEWHTWAREHISTCLALSTSMCRDASLSVSPNLASACFLFELSCTTGAGSCMAHPFLHVVFAACMYLHCACTLAEAAYMMQDSGSLWLGCHTGHHSAVLPCPPIHLSALAARLQLPSSDQIPQVTSSYLHTSSALANSLLDIGINFHRSAILDCSTDCLHQGSGSTFKHSSTSPFSSLKEAHSKQRHACTGGWGMEW